MWNRSVVPDDDESEVFDDMAENHVIFTEEPVIEVVETDSIEEIAPVEEISPVIVEEIVQEVVLEKPVEERFVIKVGDNKWLKSWSPSFELCEKKKDAIVLNSDWARGHHNRVTHIKLMKAEIVKL
jgi:hypothetical protein